MPQCLCILCNSDVTFPFGMDPTEVDLGMLRLPAPHPCSGDSGTCGAFHRTISNAATCHTVETCVTGSNTPPQSGVGGRAGAALEAAPDVAVEVWVAAVAVASRYHR